MSDIESFAVGGPQWVGGEWLDGYEFDILDDLAGSDLDAESLACDMDPDNEPLQVLDALMGLELRGFVRRLEGGLWTLTEKGAEPFGGLGQ